MCSVCTTHFENVTVILKFCSHLRVKLICISSVLSVCLLSLGMWQILTVSQTMYTRLPGMVIFHSCNVFEVKGIIKCYFPFKFVFLWVMVNSINLHFRLIEMTAKLMMTCMDVFVKYFVTCSVNDIHLNIIRFFFCSLYCYFIKGNYLSVVFLFRYKPKFEVSEGMTAFIISSVLLWVFIILCIKWAHVREVIPVCLHASACFIFESTEWF